MLFHVSVIQPYVAGTVTPFQSLETELEMERPHLGSCLRTRWGSSNWTRVLETLVLHLPAQCVSIDR